MASVVAGAGRPCAGSTVSGDAERAAAIADGHADPLRAEVEAERPHRPRSDADAGGLCGRWPARRRWPDGSLPPAVADGPLPPPPPPTARAASLMSDAGLDAGVGRDGAASDTPPASDSPTSTATRTPGCWRTASVSSRRSLGASPSTRATTTPSTAPAASSGGLAGRRLGPHRLQLVAQPPSARRGASRRPPPRRRAWCRAAAATCCSDGLLAAEQRQRALAGDRLDATQVRADRPLRHDLDRPDLAGGARRGCRRTARGWDRPPAPARRRRTCRRRRRWRPSRSASAIGTSTVRVAESRQHLVVGELLDARQLVGR